MHLKILENSNYKDKLTSLKNHKTVTIKNEFWTFFHIVEAYDRKLIVRIFTFDLLSRTLIKLIDSTIVKVLAFSILFLCMCFSLWLYLCLSLLLYLCVCLSLSLSFCDSFFVPLWFCLCLSVWLHSSMDNHLGPLLACIDFILPRISALRAETMFCCFSLHVREMLFMENS